MPLDVESTVVVLAWMLLGAAVLGMIAWRLRVPYPVVLVLGAIVVEETHLIAVPRLEPPLLLFVLLPPLLFDAAFRLDVDELRNVVRPVLLLALPGTVLTALVVGGLVGLSLHLSWSVALLFGSIVAATDPVAVVAVFRSLKAPVRLVVIAEAESLVNDGVAITLWTVMVGLVTAGQVDLLASLGTFARQIVGGVVIGTALGVAFSRLTAIIDDHRIEMTLSTALAYGSYLIAQSVETSGALACVAAGLVHGSYGPRTGMKDTHHLLDDLWEYFGFLANALVFLLVGFSVSLGSLAAQASAVLVAIVSVLFTRVLVVFGILPLMPRRMIVTTRAERAVLVWGGLRGALTITLALALPPEVPERQLLIAMAFGVVLFTLLVQGITLSFAVQRAGLAGA
jgi:monovalent cation:H+ antiporter, CPA1 family